MASYTPEELLSMQKQLRELKEIRWSGANRVKFNERDVTYRSEAELKAAIKDLEDELEDAQVVRPGYGLAVFSSGL